MKKKPALQTVLVVCSAVAASLVVMAGVANQSMCSGASLAPMRTNGPSDSLGGKLAGMQVATSKTE